MALFKIFKGNSTNLPLGTKSQLTRKSLPYQEGFAYFTPDTGRFYIDAGNERIALNAGNISFAQASSTNIDGSNLNISIGSDLSRNPRVWVPAATATLSGLLTAADQTINGEKTFKSHIIAEAGLSSGGSIGPLTNNTYALGSSTNFWSAIYASDIYGKFAVGRNLKVNLASTSAAAFDGSADVTGIGVSGTLPVTNGGTGKTSWSQYRLVYASGQTTLASLSSGTAGQVLQSGGGTQSPRWVNQSSLAAGTAEQFASVQTVELTGDVTGSVSSQAGWSLATTLANSGITAGSYGPSTNVSPSHGGSFSVPYITFDAKGRATSAYTRTITLPTYSIGNAKITIAAGSGLTTGGDFTVNQTSAKTITINHSNAITAGSVGTAQSPSHGGTFAIPKITYDAQGHITEATTVDITLPTDRNTHYTANLLLGASGATSTSTTTVSNPYMILRENSTNRNQIQIKGGTNVTVSGENGIITINSSYTDTTYSAGKGISLSGTAFSANLNSTTSLGTIGTTSKLYAVGVDAKGKLCVKVPWTDNNTTYSAGTGLSLSSTTFSLSTSGVTKGSYGPSSGSTLAHSGSFYVPYVTVDDYGRVTSVSTKTYTLPASGNTDEKVKTVAQSSTIIYVTGCTGATTGTLQYNSSVYISGSVLYGAAWNDYAEFRKTVVNVKAGQVVIENGDDSLSLATERLQPGANIVSDTYGFAIGETSTTKTPLAVSGRVLAYTYEPRETFCAGDPVCSGPNGTVSKMTREEVMMYPDRMIGTVSAIPDYETWGTGNVKVNGRIWIKI